MPILNRQTNSKAKAALDFDVESLESRKMLAGNVTATFVRGDLHITGDGDANDVAVFIDSDGRVEVEGVDSRSDTTFDTRGLASSRVTGDTKIKIFMGGGDDLVLIQGGYAESGDIDVHLGGGSDTFYGGYFNSVGEISLTGGAGSGADLIDLKYSSATSARVVTGGGNDNVTIHGVTLSNAGDGDGSLTMNTGSRDDVVSVSDIFIDGDLRAVVGSGDNDLYLEGVINSDAWIISGGGADRIIVKDTAVENSMRISTGGDEDVIDLDNVHVGLQSADSEQLRITTGGADDEVVLDDVETKLSVMFLGGGDDNLRFAGMSAALNGTFANGGGGTDATIGLSSLTGGISRRGFEF